MVKEEECSQYKHRRKDSGQPYRKGSIEKLVNLRNELTCQYNKWEFHMFDKESNPDTKANQIAQTKSNDFLKSEWINMPTGKL